MRADQPAVAGRGQAGGEGAARGHTGGREGAEEKNMRRLLIAAIALLIAGTARAQSNSAVGYNAPATPNALIGTETRTENGVVRDLDRVIIDKSWLRNAQTSQQTLGSANTPVSWATPTPTAVGASPTPTANSFKRCVVKASGSNTASVYVGDSTVTTTTGFELEPGDGLNDLPAKNGDCGGYYFVSGTGSQVISKGME